jgi:hypothetical protein
MDNEMIEDVMILNLDQEEFHKKCHLFFFWGGEIYTLIYIEKTLDVES